MQYLGETFCSVDSCVLREPGAIGGQPASYCYEARETVFAGKLPLEIQSPIIYLIVTRFGLLDAQNLPPDVY